MTISQETCLASMQEKEAPREWHMKIMQKLMVQEWSRDYQKQVTKGGYGSLEVKNPMWLQCMGRSQWKDLKE